MRVYDRNSMLPHVVQDRVLISKDAVWKWLLLFIMLLPDSAFQAICLYSSGTPSDIPYKWLDYKFGLLYLIVLIIGIINAVKKHNKWIGMAFIVMMAREVSMCLVSRNNIFSHSSFEMYLSLFTGVLFAFVIRSCCKNIGDFNKYLKILLCGNVMTIYLNAIMGLTGIEGRYNIVNLDVGTTGWVCCIALIFTIIEKNERFFCAKVFLWTFALFLSGSRVNFLITLVVIFGIVFLRILRVHHFKRRTLCFAAMGMIAVMAAVIWLLYTQNGQLIISNLTQNSRILQALNISRLSKDGSIIGRQSSLSAGIDILANNPFGIAGYFINLQRETRMRGFDTFPHFGMLDAYILFGPIVLPLYAQWIKSLFRLYKQKSEHFFLLASLVIYQIIAGGPIVNFKIYTFYALVTIFAYEITQNNLKTNRSAIQNGILH